MHIIDGEQPTLPETGSNQKSQDQFEHFVVKAEYNGILKKIQVESKEMDELKKKLEKSFPELQDFHFEPYFMYSNEETPLEYVADLRAIPKFFVKVLSQKEKRTQSNSLQKTPLPIPQVPEVTFSKWMEAPEPESEAIEIPEDCVLVYKVLRDYLKPKVISAKTALSLRAFIQRHPWAFWGHLKERIAFLRVKNSLVGLSEEERQELEEGVARRKRQKNDKIVAFYGTEDLSMKKLKIVKICSKLLMKNKERNLIGEKLVLDSLEEHPKLFQKNKKEAPLRLEVLSLKDREKWCTSMDELKEIEYLKRLVPELKQKRQKDKEKLYRRVPKPSKLSCSEIKMALKLLKYETNPKPFSARFKTEFQEHVEKAKETFETIPRLRRAFIRCKKELFEELAEEESNELKSLEAAHAQFPLTLEKVLDISSFSAICINEVETRPAKPTVFDKVICKTLGIENNGNAPWGSDCVVGLFPFDENAPFAELPNCLPGDRCLVDFPIINQEKEKFEILISFYYKTKRFGKKIRLVCKNQKPTENQMKNGQVTTIKPRKNLEIFRISESEPVESGSYNQNQTKQNGESNTNQFSQELKDWKADYITEGPKMIVEERKEEMWGDNNTKKKRRTVLRVDMRSGVDNVQIAQWASQVSEMFGTDFEKTKNYIETSTFRSLEDAINEFLVSGESILEILS